MKTSLVAKKQKGSALLEALIAILIFSVGVLSLVALQAVSMKNSIEAKYRSDASHLANQVIAQMWLDRGNIDNYGHYQSGPVCAFTGSASANTNVTDWRTQVASLLPGTASSKMQIQVTTPIASTKQVKVTVCWKSPQESTMHNFSATAHINQ